MVREHKQLPERILIYSPDAGTRLGHSFMYAATICRILAQEGQDVTLLTTRGFLTKYITSYRDLPPFKVIEVDIPKLAQALPRNTAPQMVRYIWNRITINLKALRQLGKVLRTNRYSVLHWLDNPEMFTTLYFGLLFRLRRYHKSTRWFLNLHPGDISFKRGGRHLLRRLYKGFSAWSLKFLLRRGYVTATFVHGEHIRDNLLSAWGREEFHAKVIVAPYGVGGLPTHQLPRVEARQKLGLPKEGFVVLSFGMIRRDKHIEDIIRALSLVDQAVLVIAGMPVGVGEGEIRQWIEDAHIAERTVLHLGYVPEEEIATYFSAASVVVLAHDKDFPGQSGPLHLACAFGVPVIASDVGDIGRLVKHNGLGEVFPPRDWRALAARLREFQTRGNYELYVRRMREYAEKCSWHNTVRIYLATYKSEVAKGEC